MVKNFSAGIYFTWWKFTEIKILSWDTGWDTVKLFTWVGTRDVSRVFFLFLGGIPLKLILTQGVGPA